MKTISRVKQKGEIVKKIYENRFSKTILFRNEIYKILCDNFFQKYVPRNSVVLDVGAGYCEFINNIKAKTKIALDLNPDVKKFAREGVTPIISSCTSMKKIKSNSVGVIFVNNLFEHLTKQEIVKTIKEIYRVLGNKGRLLVLQPNIRYCYKDYWMFFDHITPIDDRGLCEVLRTNNFKIVRCKPKFLPYTTKSRLSNLPSFFLKLYLKVPILSGIMQKILGKQAFIFAIKDI